MRVNVKSISLSTFCLYMVWREIGRPNLMPLFGPKGLARRQDGLNGRILEVHGRGDDVVAPPGRRVDAVEGEGEENDEGAQREAEVEPGARQKVEPAPPAEVALLDQVLEDEADDAPGQVVERGGGRDGPGAAKDDGGDEVADGRLGPAPGGQVKEHGEDGADPEKDKEARVDLARGEHAGGAEETPDDGGWLGNKLVLTVAAGALVNDIDNNNDVPEKKTLPPGHVKCSRCVGVQTSGMLPRAAFRTMIWMKHEKVVATTWAMNMVRGGIFM